MKRIDDVCRFLDRLAPLRLAEDWDNVGLLVGDRDRSADKIMTCLTITPESAAEAIDEQASLIVSHHPLPFRALKRITTDDTPGKILWRLIGAGVAIYSPHTAFDSAAAGINQRLAQAMGLAEIRPLTPHPDETDQLGAGRWGLFAQPTCLHEVAGRLKSFLKVDRLRCVGDVSGQVSRAAVGCGSGGAFLDEAKKVHCDLLVTGEANFHSCLEAQASGIALLLTGHYASERFAIEELATVLGGQFPQSHVWVSQRETDPLSWC